MFTRRRKEMWARHGRGKKDQEVLNSKSDLSITKKQVSYTGKVFVMQQLDYQLKRKSKSKDFLTFTKRQERKTTPLHFTKHSTFTGGETGGRWNDPEIPEHNLNHCLFCFKEVINFNSQACLGDTEIKDRAVMLGIQNLHISTPTFCFILLLFLFTNAMLFCLKTHTKWLPKVKNGQ